MQYLMLIYENPTTWETFTAQERRQIAAEANAIIDELTETGEWLLGHAVADPEHTRTVRTRDGLMTATDGLFLETKEHMVGYGLLDVETLARAEEIAGRWPNSRSGAIELRPVMSPRACGM